jgi:hypothetical protein
MAGARGGRLNVLTSRVSANLHEMGGKSEIHAAQSIRGGFLMKLATAHEPLGDVGGLQHGTFGR